MIAVIRGSKAYKKTMEIIKIANIEGGKKDKEVLIITKFDIGSEIFSSNIKIAKSSDENIADLVATAEVILIDEPGSMLEGAELTHLGNLGKQVYYTAQSSRTDMPFDRIIEVC